MAKPLKIVLWIVGGFVLLIAGAAIALPLLFDPNGYKPQITQAVKDATGRDFTIGGDIKLKIFPWLGAGVSGVTLGNAEGFGPEPFAQVGEVGVSVRLLPLILHQQIQAGAVILTGLRLNLTRAADGAANWDDLAELGKEDPDRPASEKPQPEKSTQPIAFSVGGLDLRDAQLVFDDRQAGAVYKIENLSLQSGEVALGKPLDLTLAFLASASEPQVAADVKLALTLASDLDAQVHEARNLALDLSASGAPVPGGRQTVTLRGNARFDQKQDALSLPDLVLQVAGLSLNAAIEGTGLTGDTPALGGKLSTNTFNPRELAKKLDVELPPTADAKALSRVSVAANYTGDFSSAKLDGLTLKLDDSTATGTVHVTDFATQAMVFALKMDAIDADRYLPPPEPEPAKSADKSGTPDINSIELPYEALDAVNAKGTAEIDALTLKGVKLGNVKLALDAPKGRVKTQNLTAKLYGGEIRQSARITPGTQPAWDIKAGLNQVNAGPLLQDFLGKDYLTGAGNFNIDVGGRGKTVGDLLKGLNGNLATSLLNGAIEGFNLDQTLGTARALYKREPLPAAAGDAPQRTAFSDLKASGRIENGVLKTSDLNAKGSWYRLTGDGNVNLAGQTVDYTLRPTVTGDKYKDLQGTAIPVRVTGSLFSPSVKVDLESVLKAKAKEEVKEEVKKQEDKLKEKYGDRLDELFKKR